MRAYRLNAGPGPEYCVEGNREDEAHEVWIVTAPTEQAAIHAAIRHAVTLNDTGVEVTLEPTRAWLDLAHDDWATDEELLEQAFKDGLTVLPGEPPVYYWPHDWLAQLVENHAGELVTIDLPPEMLAFCEHDGTDPDTVLRGFIADLCGIMNYVAKPRTDGYSSNGSDEREMALAYYCRIGYPYMGPSSPWKQPIP